MVSLESKVCKAVQDLQEPFLLGLKAQEAHLVTQVYQSIILFYNSQSAAPVYKDMGQHTFKNVSVFIGFTFTIESA